MMEEFTADVKSLLGIQISSAQLRAFEIFERELLDWNTRFNLTAINDPGKVRGKHFLDSLTCLLAMRGTSIKQVIDVGTGAGFPGIPLKIICPAMKLTLVESIGKKANFCQHITDTLELKDVKIDQIRAESIGGDPDHRQAYDWAVARAVADLPVLAEYLLPLVRLGGYALAMKGESGPAEAHRAEPAIQLLGGQLQEIIPVILPGIEDQRYLVVIAKIASTPERFPRRVGIPAKRPLIEM